MILDEIITINALLSNYCRQKLILQSLGGKVPNIIGNLLCYKLSLLKKE